MYIVVSAVIFVLVVSIDLFACGFAYGANNIKVPFKKVLVINVTGKVLVGAGLFAGYFLGGLMADEVGIWLGFSILFTLGLIKTIQWYLTRKKINKVARQISWREAFVLGALLSFDGLAAGLGVTISDMPFSFIFIVLGISLISDQLVFSGSRYLGQKVTKKANLNLGWLCGVTLMTVAVCKLFFELFT
jgi:putative Mn2+ efflux pump MntP